MRRFCCAVLVLLGLSAPILARGDDTPQPMPVNGQCSVSADPQWTRQEKFVWQHVCVGEVADFNKEPEPNYGGNLDPKRPEGLPESRILRPDFLETILFSDAYRRSLKRHGVRILGARLTENLDLENARLEIDFRLRRSLLEKGANFSGLRSAYPIDLEGSKIIGLLRMDRLRVESGLSMRWGEFSEVSLADAQVGGQLALRGANITKQLTMSEVQIGASLYMNEAQFGKIVLRNVHVGGVLELNGSKVRGALHSEGVQVKSDVFMSGYVSSVPVLGMGPITLGQSQSREAEFDGPVHFLFGKVGGNFVISGGYFHLGSEYYGNTDWR